MPKAIPISANLALFAMAFQSAPAADFDRDIAPVIDTYYISCHDAVVSENWNRRYK